MLHHSHMSAIMSDINNRKPESIFCLNEYDYVGGSLNDLFPLENKLSVALETNKFQTLIGYSLWAEASHGPLPSTPICGVVWTDSAPKVAGTSWFREFSPTK